MRIRDILVSWRGHRRGQGMLEFALAIPVFLLLLLGIIEFGRMFLMYTSLFAAAREGARYGAAVETLCDQTGLEDAARRVGFFAGDMAIGVQYDDGYGNTKTCGQTVLGDRVHVTTTIYFRSITGVIPQIPLRSIARRTIIRQVFLQWTLEPTSAIAGAIPPTATFGPPPGTPTPSLTPDPNATQTLTPTFTHTPTITNTPEPPVCSWAWEVGSTADKFYYQLNFKNDSASIQPLNEVTVSWVSNDGKISLTAIDYFYYSGGSVSIGDGLPDSDGMHYEDVREEGIGINPGETGIVRFTFTKQSTTILAVILNFSNGGSECIVKYP